MGTPPNKKVVCSVEKATRSQSFINIEDHELVSLLGNRAIKSNKSRKSNQIRFRGSFQDRKNQFNEKHPVTTGFFD